MSYMFRLLPVTNIRVIPRLQKEKTIQLEYFSEIADFTNVLCKVYNVQNMYVRKD
jgi:hypothetical protein